MNTLVVDHSYALGIAWDRSPFRNHGALLQTPPGTGYFQRSLSFKKGRSAPGSAVAIPPSPSLADLGAIRVRATIYTDLAGGRRQNIAEGQLAFALFLNGDLSLQGTFLAASGQWNGVRSAAGAVTAGQWHQVEYSYDGISVGELLVDGVRVASSFNAAERAGAPMVGPVRGVGKHGIFVGHWPEADDRYTLNGYVRDFQLYKRDPLKDAAQLLDPCCMRDFDRWYEFAHKAGKDGLDRDAARRMLADLVAVASELMAKQRGGTEAERATYDALVTRLLFAVQNRGSMDVQPALHELMTWMRRHLRLTEYRDYADALRKIVSDLPFSAEELAGLADDLCFSGWRKAVNEEVERAHRAFTEDDRKHRDDDRRTPNDATPRQPKPRGRHS